MFTGIIEEIGKIVQVKTSRQSVSCRVACAKITAQLAVGDSVAVNGVCLTVIAFNKQQVDFEVMQPTWEQTTLQYLAKGSLVNLERSLLATSRLGGHFVTGHVDGIAIIARIKKQLHYYQVWLTVPNTKYCPIKGSIALDGVSLTIQEKKKDSVAVGIIPHTFQTTTLKSKQVGDKINVEFDMLAKYIDNILQEQKQHSSRQLQKFLR